MTSNAFNPQGVEILAPCGSYDILKSAISAGADACYLGGKQFGARAYATNFGDDVIYDALDYAHLHGVKIYLTVNTLLKESEMSSLFEYLRPLYEAGLDAVIVQDLGVFSYIRKYLPELPVHLSTQMNITSYHAAKLMKAYGAKRVVPAREMSFTELKALKDKSGLEVEVFCHGAMCVSYSGRCLMSSLAGGRSGNRGRCAQTCRKCYDGEYKLSMRDLCTLEILPEILATGVDSLKIEGRMKNAYYVASAVEAYKNTVEDIMNDSFDLKKAADRKLKLAEVFSRGGFTTGYFFGVGDRYDTFHEMPGHTGVEIGTVDSTKAGAVDFKLRYDLNRGDVIVFRTRDGSEVEITSGTDAKAGSMVSLPAPKTKYINQGAKAYRVRNEAFNDDLYKRHINSYSRKIHITGELSAKKGEKLEFTLYQECFGNVISGVACSNERLDTANSIDPDMEESIIEKLKATGDTDYVIDNVDMKVEKGVFVPFRLVKDIRRKALDALEKNVKESYRRLSIQAPSGEKTYVPVFTKAKSVLNYVTVETMEQLYACMSSDAISGVCMNHTVYKKAAVEGTTVRLKLKGIKIYIMLDDIIRAGINDKLDLVNEGISGIYIKCIDEVAQARELEGRERLEAIVSSSVYAMNTYAAGFIRQNLKSFKNVYLEEPRELNEEELSELAGAYEVVPVYGYEQVMVTRQSIDSEKITDDSRNTYYVIPGKLYDRIYNGIPFFATDRKNIQNPGIALWRFTIESPDEIVKLLNGYVPKNKTYGHLKRGIT